MSEQNTVTIDDVEYIFEDLPEAIQHVLGQIQYSRDAVQNATLEVQRLEMMQRGYIAELADRMREFQASNDH